MEELKIKLYQIVKELINDKFIKNLCSFNYLFS